MSTTPYQHKKGDSLELVVTIPVQFADGYFTGYEFASQVRTQGGAKVADLVCAWLDPVTTRSMRLTCIDTSAWPVGPAKFDVQFKRVADNFVVSTTTQQMYVVEDVTQPND